MLFTVIWLNLALLAMARILLICPSRGLSTCMAMAVKVSLPCSVSSWLKGMHLLHLMAFNSSRILSHLGWGRLIVLVMPSSIQPWISLHVSHVLSSMSFFVDMGAPILLPVSDGEGKMSVIAWRRDHVSLLI